MSLTLIKDPSGFIRMQVDDTSARVLGEFLTTDTAHMPSVVQEFLKNEGDDQVIMDACRIVTKDEMVEIGHLYLEDLPVFKASRETMLDYIAQWEQFLTSDAKELQLSLNK